MDISREVGLDLHSPAPIRYQAGYYRRVHHKRMKLTIELDTGARHTIELPKFAGDRLKTMQDMCILLNAQIDNIELENGDER
jgi:hypothetical protein